MLFDLVLYVFLLCFVLFVFSNTGFLYFFKEKLV